MLRALIMKKKEASRACPQMKIKGWFCCMWVIVKEYSVVIDRFVACQLTLCCFSILGNLVNVITVILLEGFSCSQKLVTLFSVRFEIFMVRPVKTCVFWDVTLCCLAGGSRWSEGCAIDIYPCDHHFLCTLVFILVLLCFYFLKIKAYQRN
jgi:hypothetical protein